MTAPAPTFAVGLRFNTRDAALLAELADRAGRMELPEAASLFTAAANATRRAEPMLLFCENATEAITIANSFPRRGVERPAIEQLNGLIY